MGAPSPVLILTGPPGAGKTTTAKLLAAEAERAAHVEADRFFHFIASGYVEPWRPESKAQNEAVMRAVGDTAAAYASGGYLTIVEGIVIPGWFFEPLRDRLADAGHEVAYAVLRAPLELCLERTTARENQALADPHVVESLWSTFSDLGELERHVIDVAEDGPEAVAETVRRRLSDGSLAA